MSSVIQEDSYTEVEVRRKMLDKNFQKKSLKTLHRKITLKYANLRPKAPFWKFLWKEGKKLNWLFIGTTLYMKEQTGNVFTKTEFYLSA